MEKLWSERGYLRPLWVDHILVYYPIISYQKIKVYSVETMDMVIFHWNNGVSEKCNPSNCYGIFYTG